MEKKILVIDDEIDVVEFQRSYLTRRGFTVFTATDSKLALEILQKESPQVVFCDCRIDDDADGLMILEQAKKINPDIIFFLITGFIDKEIEKKGLALGVKEILAKPLSCAELSKKIQEAFL